MRLWKRSSPLTFEAFGVQVEVRCDATELDARVREILPPGWRPCDPTEEAGQFGLHQTEPGGYEVTVGEVPGLEHATLDVAVGMLDAQIRMFIAANARDWVFMHAGVVAQDGKALVIPGESFSGKTTLVTALVAAGALYYSDEYAVLDGEGRVHPYPRRLSIRGTDGTLTEERAIGELGGVAAQVSAELGAVAITRYRPGTQWQPRRLSPGQGVLALLANTVPARERPQESLHVLSRAVTGATVLEGDRGEAGPTAAALLAEVGALSGRPS